MFTARGPETMDYRGRYSIFDTGRIRTYPLGGRASKVPREALAQPKALAEAKPQWTSAEMRALTGTVLKAREEGKPVIWMTGAHLIKNGFGPLLRDLLARGLVTLVGVNMAGMIHDLELALVGCTSEDVPRALPKGEFGFADETCRLLNGALTHGERLAVGAGEAIGRLIAGEPFPDSVHFPHAELSLAAGAWAAGKPLTVHAMVGTDIIDQHPSWDPAAKGGTSGRDFLIFCAEVEKMAGGGGVYLNVGTQVMGPEVFLKACSMAANVGHPPLGLTTGSFDIRAADPADVDDERSAGVLYAGPQERRRAHPAGVRRPGLLRAGRSPRDDPRLLSTSGAGDRLRALRREGHGMNDWIKEHIRAAASLTAALERSPEDVARLGQICATVIKCLEGGGKVLTLGNGGSATDAQHLAEELVGRYLNDRLPLPAVSLASDVPTLTCIANDYGFDQIFARQVEALAKPGDVVVAFSTSGNSPNVVEALKAARAKGAVTIGLLGRDGGKAAALCDVCFVARHDFSARIQEVHALALHLVCEAVERRFAKA